jgi:hypothetical protein
MVYDVSILLLQNFTDFKRVMRLRAYFIPVVLPKKKFDGGEQ